MISWFAISLSEGIYGFLIYVSANIIFIFILFGTILEVTRAREFFTLVGTLAGQRLRGGAAQTSVISSALVGSVTGSPAANIIITGSVTIPLMKRAGFRANFAAAVEACSSSGGILLPPVMGTMAFVMMSLTGLTYWSICVAAVIPAVLYYFGVGTSVYLYAAKANIPTSEEEIDLRLLLRRAPLFIIPFMLITVLLALQFSPMYAAGWAIVAALVLGFISKDTRPTLSSFVAGLTQGAKTASSIATMLILANMAFISVMSLTGIGPTLAGVIFNWGGGYLPAVLVVTMFASLLLGCLTLVGAYLLVALIVAPLLIEMGLAPMQAHFFALYYTVIAYLTPPVAPAAIISSRMAQCSWLSTAGQAWKLVGAGAIFPFLFSYDPALLGHFSSGPLLGLLSIVAAVLATFNLAIVLHSYYLTRLGWLERGLAALSVVGFLAYFFTRGHLLAVVAGVACFILLTLWQLRKKRVRE